MDGDLLVKRLKESLLKHNATTEEHLEKDHKLNEKSTSDQLPYLYNLYADILYFRLEQAKNEHKLTTEEYETIQKQINGLKEDGPKERNVSYLVMMFEKNQRLLDNESKWSSDPIIKKAIQEIFDGIPPERNIGKDELLDMYEKTNARAIDTLHRVGNQKFITKEKKGEEYRIYKQISNGRPSCVVYPDDCRARIDSLAAFHKRNKTRSNKFWRPYVNTRQGTRRVQPEQITLPMEPETPLKKNVLIEKLVNAFFDGTRPDNSTLAELFHDAVDITRSSLYFIKFRNYITQDKYKQEIEILNHFDDYNCDGDRELCSDKVDQLIRFYEDNKRRYTKKLRPFINWFSRSNGGRTRQPRKKKTKSRKRRYNNM